MIRIFTDGSCLGNPGPGGWAYVIRDGENEVEGFGAEQQTTNNRMELMAAIQALKALPSQPQTVVLHSDSQLLIKTMSHGWKRKKNLDLWAELDQLSAQHQVGWQWVRGHDGNADNERCDRLAQQAASTAGVVR
jgi:ribonuclease HI